MREQHRKKFILFKRKAKKGYVWYYRLAGEKTGHTTGESVKWKAIEYIESVIFPEIERPGRITLGEYLEPYFVWDKCPHVRRLRTEGKSISQQYAHAQRRRIEMYPRRMFFPQRLTFQLDSVRCVKDAIADGIRDGWISDYLVPHGYRNLRDDDRGAPSDSIFQDFQQSHPTLGIKGLEPDIIENK